MIILNFNVLFVSISLLATTASAFAASDCCKEKEAVTKKECCEKKMKCCDEKDKTSLEDHIHHGH